jgi:predicted RNA-binding Zn-ribbon protein involved in translation (DUF1610 family)
MTRTECDLKAIRARLSDDEFVEALRKARLVLESQGAFTEDYAVYMNCYKCKQTFTAKLGDPVWQEGSRFYCPPCGEDVGATKHDDTN